MKIQILGLHLRSIDTWREIREAHQENREVSDLCAKTIASWWQSAGSPGSAFAALASGAETTSENVWVDLKGTLTMFYEDLPADDKLALDMLGTWLLDWEKRQKEPVKDYSFVAPQINRYFLAVYGRDYVYRVPETFDGFESWMLAVASGKEKLADEQMTKIEKLFNREVKS